MNLSNNNQDISVSPNHSGSVKPAFGGTVTEAGGYFYHTFTGSGDFRYAKQ